MSETTVVDVRTRDLSEFEDGEAVRVHYRDAADEPHKCVTGRIQVRYTDRKALLETDDGQELIVDLADVTEDNIRDRETGEYLGRGMFAETAYHPEQDGEDLRDEILGDGGEDQPEYAHAARDLAEGDRIAVTAESVTSDDPHTFRREGVVQNVGRGRVRFQPDDSRTPSLVFPRSGVVKVKNGFKDVVVGRDATVTLLEADE